MSRQTLKNIYRMIEEATKEIPLEESFVADINVAIQKLDEQNTKLPSTSYNPSSLVCVRNMYFKATNAPQDERKASPELIGMGEVGTYRHERLQRAISEMRRFGIDCEWISVSDFIESRKLTDLEVVGQDGFETLVHHKRLNMRFKCDGIIRYKGQYFILEIKTESIYKWQNRQGVAEEHVAQGVAYSTAFGINQVMFLYENRDTCAKKAYILEVTDEMKMNEVIGKIEEADYYVKKLVPPPKPTDLPRNACTYCPYKTECQKAGV
jgi:CRISPR/Cas system-associated exonuclease Cas4 (RecB family)